MKHSGERPVFQDATEMQPKRGAQEEMASLTLKKIPEAVMKGLRTLAERERRSLNQQAILLLERGLEEDRPGFLEAHEAFVRVHGAPPFGEDFFEHLRSPDTARPAPFEDDDDR